MKPSIPELNALSLKLLSLYEVRQQMNGMSELGTHCLARNALIFIVESSPLQIGIA